MAFPHGIGRAYELPSCRTLLFTSPNGESRSRQVVLYRRSNQIIDMCRRPTPWPKHAKSFGQACNHDTSRISCINIGSRGRSVGVRAAATATKRYPGEEKGFVEEMRHVALRLHTRDVAKEGTNEPDAKPIGKWEPTIQGYLKFLLDSKLVYDTLEDIVYKPTHPAYAEFRKTGLERSESLAKDLEWLRQQGYSIPGPSSPGISYAKYLQELSEKDPPAFICHFYNFYFAHTAGGRMIGKKVAEKILDGKELEFYKWDGNLKELLHDVREKLNKVAEGWSREEKNHCLEETEKSFAYSGKLLRLIIS